MLANPQFQGIPNRPPRVETSLDLPTEVANDPAYFNEAVRQILKRIPDITDSNELFKLRHAHTIQLNLGWRKEIDQAILDAINVRLAELNIADKKFDEYKEGLPPPKLM